MKRFRNVHKRIKNLERFWLWFNKRKALLNRGELTVPEDIFFLPSCLCHRKPGDKKFHLSYDNVMKQWVHYCPHNNEIPNKLQGTPMVPVPQVVERRRNLPNLFNHPEFSADDLFINDPPKSVRSSNAVVEISKKTHLFFL